MMQGSSEPQYRSADGRIECLANERRQLDINHTTQPHTVVCDDDMARLNIN